MHCVCLTVSEFASMVNSLQTCCCCCYSYCCFYRIPLAKSDMRCGIFNHSIHCPELDTESSSSFAFWAIVCFVTGVIVRFAITAMWESLFLTVKQDWRVGMFCFIGRSSTKIPHCITYEKWSMLMGTSNFPILRNGSSYLPNKRRKEFIFSIKTI